MKKTPHPAYHFIHISSGFVLDSFKQFDTQPYTHNHISVGAFRWEPFGGTLSVGSFRWDPSLSLSRNLRLFEESKSRVVST